MSEESDLRIGHDLVETAGRAGLVSRGLLYLISALLTGQIALGDLSSSGAEGPGQEGALTVVARQPLGRVLVAVLAAGLAGHALWRFTSAVLADGDDRDEWRSWIRRLTQFGRGCIYTVGVVTAISLMVGDKDSDSGGGVARMRWVFDLPAGRWLVGGVGVGFLVAAGANGYRAVARRFEGEWSDDLTSFQRKVAKGFAVAGLVGRTVVLGLVGFFLLKAAWEFDPSEPRGLDEAIKTLADERYGTVYLLALAVAMGAFAVFSFLQARWRRISDE